MTLPTPQRSFSFQSSHPSSEPSRLPFRPVLPRLRASGGLLAVLLLACTAPASAVESPRRVVLVSWDGAANWVIERLRSEGKLPNVERMARSGVHAAYCVPAFPSKTACGHAAIWTGAYGDVNGVTGNAVPLLPRSEHTLLESISGFNSAALRAEPIWITAAKSGKRVVVLSATQSYPPAPYVATLKAAGVPADRFVSFSGFESPVASAKMIDAGGFRPAEGWTGLPAYRGTPRELQFTVGEDTFYALAYDDPSDSAEGLDTLLIRQGSKEEKRAKASCILKPWEAGSDLRRYSVPFRVRSGALSGNTYFRLFALSPDGSRMALYQRAAAALRGTASAEETEKYVAAYGGFHDVPFFDLYRSGKMGRPLWEGGDGTAEKRLVELAQLDCEFLKRSVRYAWKHWKPDLLLHYTPVSDSAGHTWMGALDPEAPGHNPALAARIWPYYTQILQMQDSWLGDILDVAGKDAAVCLVSDHGMEGVRREFSPNAVLEKAGLLFRTPAGQIDLTRTKIAAPPWGDFFLCVNSLEWKGGIVARLDRPSVLRAATEALLAAVDPETGKHVVTRVFDPTGVLGIGMGGEAGGDLYLDLETGYAPTGRTGGAIARASATPIGEGVHGFYPYRRKMQAICYLAGQGVRSGVTINGMRQIDIAPTLARLLGVPAPRDAVGHVLGEALERPESD